MQGKLFDLSTMLWKFHFNGSLECKDIDLFFHGNFGMLSVTLLSLKKRCRAL